MNNLLQRSLTGTLYVILMLAAILIHPVGLMITTLLINLVALMEFARIGNKLGIHLTGSWIAINMFLMILVLIIMQTGWNEQLLVLPGVIFILLIFILSLYQKKGNPLYSASFSIYGCMLITLPLILLNLVHEISVSKAIPFTLAIFIFIWSNDTFAYLAGMAFGRHKLFPRITPKKSWEGFIGGILMTIAAGIVMNRFYPAIGLGNWMSVALLTSVSAVYGDFNESLLKRIANLKDSGTILPGHGGILDRIDSLLFATPVIYIYLIIFYSIEK